MAAYRLAKIHNRFLNEKKRLICGVNKFLLTGGQYANSIHGRLL